MGNKCWTPPPPPVKQSAEHKTWCTSSRSVKTVILILCGKKSDSHVIQNPAALTKVQSSIVGLQKYMHCLPWLNELAWRASGNTGRQMSDNITSNFKILDRIQIEIKPDSNPQQL